MTTEQVKVILPAGGSIGKIKPRKAKETIGIILEHPDFEIAYNKIHPNNRVAAAHTGKFEYRWEYASQDDAYLLYVSFTDGVGFAVKFIKDQAGQILQKLVELNKKSPMFGIILRYKEHRSPEIFDNCIALIGLEFDKDEKADWPK